MSDTPAPPPRTATRPWWLPGAVLGTALAAVALLVALLLPANGTHRAVAAVQLRPAAQFSTALDENHAAYRDRQRFLLKSHSLVTQTLAEPAVADLATVRAAADPVANVIARLDVRDATDDILEVSLTGNNIEDMKVIVEHLVKRYVDDATGFDQRERNEKREKLVQLTESTRVEVEALEKNIELLVKANGTGSGLEGEFRTALFRQRLTTAEEAHTRINRELARLEAERTVLKRQADQKGAAADLDRDARLRQLTTDIDIKKEERESLRVERDALLKAMTIGGGADWDIERMRAAVRPQRAELDKIGVHLAQVRMADRVSGRVEMRGGVSVSPTRTPAERWTAAGTAAATAFGAGFALATAFSFVGLVLRVLQRHA